MTALATWPIVTGRATLALVVQFDATGLCPCTGNPQPASTASVAYTPRGVALKPETIRPALLAIAKAEPRDGSMEGIFAQLAEACSDALGVAVALTIAAQLHDGSVQTMHYAVAPQ